MSCLCFQAQTTPEPRVESSLASTPSHRQSHAARDLIADLISKMLQCLEKTFLSIAKAVTLIVQDVATCINKSAPDFFKCLLKTDMPKRVTETINALVETSQCIILT